MDDATWHKAADIDELPEGRVKTVAIGRRSLALTHYDGRYGALDNKCPHQGGPLGEGSIERGWLRCPWHGYDYNPLEGTPPPPFSDGPSCFSTEVRADGVYVELPPERPTERTAADVLVETMIAWGVTHVFGMVGHSNLGFADAMRKAEERGELTFIGIRHEGAASFATSAFGKLTGNLAACFAIAGPGSTNLLTGLYDAMIDESPALAISGQVPSQARGRGAFQDVDLDAAFADVSVYSQTVATNSDFGELMSLAAKHALVERGVGHLTLPDDVQIHPAPGVAAKGPAGRIGSRRIGPPADALADAAATIRDAQRPLFILGKGARDGVDAITDLAVALGTPVATTFKAKGLVPDTHPLGCGVLGRSGTPIASWFMNECDLVVAWGASFSNHTGIADYKPIVQVDREPMALGRFHPVDVPVQGDAGITATRLAETLGEVRCQDLSTEVAQRWEIWRAEKQARIADDAGKGLGSAAIFAALTRTAPADAVICVDVGNNTYSFGRYFEAQGQTVLMSGYLGSIGFGLPAAMGAWAAVGNARTVISVSGDGGLGQYAMELTTAAKYGMNITHLLLNNGELGKISKEQRAAEWDVWQTGLHNPDFAAFAELCGVKGTRVTEVEALDEAITAALAHEGPSLVEIMADPLLV